MAAFDAFMIPNSPKGKKDETSSSTLREILTLAPFNPSPKIIFQDVKVGQARSQQLDIYNPGKTHVQVELSSKTPLADQQIELSSTNFEIAAGEKFSLQITYKPVEPGTCKIPILLRTNTKFRSDFTILCVATAPKGQKKVLRPENGSVPSARPKAAVVPPPPIRKPASEPPERRKTFVLRGNKENVAQPKKPSPPEPAPRRLLPTSPVRPSLLDNLVISPFVSAPNRFKEVELSPAVNGPWKKELPAPVPESIRRETYGVDERITLPTPFMAKLGSCEEIPVPVDTTFLEHSFANNFEPVTCSTTVKISVSREGSLGSLRTETDRLSGSTYVVDRLSTGTFVKESEFDEARSPTPDLLRPHSPRAALSGSILGCISEEVIPEEPATAFEISPLKQVVESVSEEVVPRESATAFEISPPKQVAQSTCEEVVPKESATAFEISPPKQAVSQKALRTSPKVVTKRKIVVSPQIRIFSPDTPENPKPGKNVGVPKIAMPRLTLTRGPAMSRHSVGGPSRVSHSLQKQTRASAASSSRPSLTSAASMSRPSLTSTASMSRPSLTGAASSSRPSLSSAHSSSRLSLASTASSSRQSFASAASSSRNTLSFQSCNSQLSSTSRRAKRQEKSEFLYDTDALISEMINNDLVAASTSADPFLTNTLFFDDSWKLKQEKDMIKWLNVLLTPPAELVADTEPTNLDIADVWQRCCRTDQVDLAPTREVMSSDMYNAQARLMSLRKAAISFLAKTEIRQVLGKVAVHIDKKLLVVRDDKDLHLDTGLKYQVIELLLSYNPLWLRIGLEAIYGRTVTLISNSDVVGLARFMLENLLSDKNIAATHSHPTVPHLRLPTFSDAMKKFILKKFFFLVYFLDRAKANKLIGHDPCLFLKNAKYKESKDVLIAFASMFLSGVGDILKHLSLLGYHVTVKQQYLDEFEFAVTSLKDLRDGVRLVRVMEVILKNDSLMGKLRVPAISMLQKVHNMEIALKALQDCGYQILGNITAKDLVNGHYEKTLSLLWQIIYKFQAPRLESAAKVVQAWWRKRRLFCEIRKRIAERKRARCIEAAVRIQAAWRACLARRRVVHLRIQRAVELERRHRAAIVIQKTWRMFAARKQFVRAIVASNRIKEWFTGAIITRELRAKFLRKRNAVIKIQSLLRGYLTRKRFAHLRRTAAALRIQTWFRRRRSAKLIEKAAILARSWVEERERQTKACLVIQTRLRAYKEMKKYKSEYIALRKATVVLQRRFRLVLRTKRDRMAFLTLRRSAIFCQQKLRAKWAMEEQRRRYLALKQSAIVVQRRFRAKRDMLKVRERFLIEKTAAVKIQTWFGSVRKMRQEREEFLRMKRAVKIVESRYEALVAARQQKALFETMRSSAVVIQGWYRRTKQMKTERFAFVEKRRSALVIQRAYRAYKLRQIRNSSAIFIQQKWRATLQMRAQQRAYISLRSSAVFLQTWWRSVQLMRLEKARYGDVKKAAVIIQKRWRAVLAGRKAREDYVRLRMAAVTVQRHWRAKVEMERCRTDFLQTRSALIVIQKHVRSFLRHRQEERLKKAVTFVQRKWRAKKEIERLRNEFLAKRKAVISIQRWYRLNKYLKSGAAAKLQEEQAATKIQSLWRGYITRKKQCAASAEIKERCRMAAKAACEERTLGYISYTSLNNFRLGQSGKTFEALVALHKITVLSRELCIHLAEVDVVTDMYSFLSGLNRSELHREFLVHGTSILLNLAKCQETTRFVWQNGRHVVFYLHLMNIWLNKEQEVFLNCATVLWHFSQYPEYAEEMLAEPKMKRHLDIFARKTSKKKSLLSFNQNVRILPSETPSWGLALKDKKPPRFIDELFAVEVLYSTLYGS